MKANKWIGVDIHKKQITICIMTKGQKNQHLVYERTSEGIEGFLNHIDKETIVGVESTTWTRDFAVKCLDRAKDVIVFNTVDLKDLMDKTKKTDKIDSAKMALILKRFEKDELSTCSIKSDYFAEVKGLLKIRENLVKKKTETKNEIIAMLDYWGSSRKTKFFMHMEKDKVWINNQVKIPVNIRFSIIRLVELIEEYELQIKDIGEMIEEKLTDHKGYNKIKSSIKGIGKTTAAYIVSKIEKIERFETHKKLVSYFGLAPKVNESDGKGSNGRISKNTDKGLLRCLIQAAWISVRYDGEMKNFYQNLKKRKCSQKAIVAVARKLVINCFYTLKQAEA